MHALGAWPDTGDGGQPPRPEKPTPQRKTKRGGVGFSGIGGCPPSPVSGHAPRACAPAQGVPPPLLWAGCYPPPLLTVPACRVLGAHAARGVPLRQSRGSGVSPLPCMTCTGSARYLGGNPSSSSCLGGFPSSRLGMLCAGSAHCRSGGSPPSYGLVPRAVGARGSSPASSCPHLVCARCCGWGAPSSSWALSSFGLDVTPPLSSPSLHAVCWGRTLLGGSP